MRHVYFCKLMKKNSPGADSLPSKQHFDILDGLRGVAALAVVIFHFTEWVFTPDKNFIGHGFLAVDFFFCLSGFVMGYAYDQRLETMGVVSFLKRRLIRLHPLVILGSVLGLLGFLVDPFEAPSAAHSAGKIAILFLGSVFLVPLPQMEERFFNLFSFNAPAWSLFWEYAANIVYVIILYRVRRISLAVFTILAAIVLGIVSYRAGNLLGGWDGKSFWDGGARIAYSFAAGLLIYRSNWIIKNRIGFIGLAVLLSLAFIMPSSKWNWLTELLVVLIYFPLLVSLGAGSILFAGIKKICKFSGNISYPLYMTHYAFIWIFGHYFLLHKPVGAQLNFIIISGVVLLVGISWLVMVLYDVPVRKWLSKKMLP